MKYCLFTILLALCATAQAQIKTEYPGGADRNAPANRPVATVQEAQQPVVYTYVEQMPAPNVDMATYLSQNVKYPDNAKKKGVEGKVIIKFVVNEDGSLSDFSVLRGIGGGCDEEALRVMKQMPPWKPGKQNGKAVKVAYIQPISFKLN